MMKMLVCDALLQQQVRVIYLTITAAQVALHEAPLYA